MWWLMVAFDGASELVLAKVLHSLMVYFFGRSLATYVATRMTWRRCTCSGLINVVSFGSSYFNIVHNCLHDTAKDLDYVPIVAP
jgi:hypothetical protein